VGKPRPFDLTTPAGRRRFGRLGSAAMIGQMGATEPEPDLVMLVLSPTSGLARHVLRRLDAVLGVDHEPMDPDSGEVSRWAPRAWLGEMLASHDEDAARAVSSRVRAGRVRLACVLPDESFDVFDVVPDRVVLRDNIRDRTHEDHAREHGVPLENLPAMPRAYVVGSWRDPNRYLPSKLPQGWRRRTLDSLAPVRVTVRRTVIVDVGPMPLGTAKLVVIMMQHAREDRPPTDEEAAEVLSALCNVERLREAVPAKGAEWLVPPGWRVFAGDSRPD
jgi:hypothetical protein